MTSQEVDNLLANPNDTLLKFLAKSPGGKLFSIQNAQYGQELGAQVETSNGLIAVIYDHDDGGLMTMDWTEFETVVMVEEEDELTWITPS